MANKTEVINLKVTPELKAQAKAQAEAEGRSLSNYIEQLILRDGKKE